MNAATALATYFVLAALLFWLFAGRETRLDGGVRAAMRRFVRPEPGVARDDSAWARAFLGWFDHIFAVRHRELPWLGRVPFPSFWRSVLVSFLSLLCLALVWAFNKQSMGRALRYEQLGQSDLEGLATLVIIYGGGTLITNWVPDYLSLIESRMVMERLARARSWPRRCAWLAVDAAATLAIALGALHLGMRVVLPLVAGRYDLEVGCLTPESYSFATTWTLFVSGLRFESPPGTLNYDATGIYVYSAFFTSLWLWVYLLGGFVLRAYFALRGGSGSGRRGDRPLRALAVAVVLAFSAVFWLAWTDRRAHGAEVFIEHGLSPEELALARSLVAELELEGLHVRSRAQVDAMTRAQLLARADTVVVLAGASPESAAETEATLVELQLQQQCGERPWGSTALVLADAADGGASGWPDPRGAWTFAWSPWGTGAEVANFAKHANGLLDMSQLRECQLQHGYPAVPAVCDARDAR